MPAIIAKTNARDEEALAFSRAAIGILDNMPGAQRPRTSKKLAQIIDLQEFDADHTQTQYPFGLGALARIDGFS